MPSGSDVHRPREPGELFDRFTRSRSAPVVVFLVFSGYAGLLALGGEVASHHTWARAAAAGYAIAAVVHLAPRARPWSAHVAAVLSIAVPAVAVGAADQRQEEVSVVERSTELLLATGSPYRRDPVEILDFNPYLPGMSAFGLPHAAGAPGVLGDPRLWLALVFVAAVAAALHMLTTARARSIGRDEAWRFSFVLSCPPVALSVCVSGIDLPVTGLVVLTVVAAGTGRSVITTVALLGAMALKWTAWPAAAVTAATLTATRGARTAAVSTLVAVAAAGLLLAPATVLDARAFVQNAVEYPFGLSSTASTAASPLPGRLLADHVPGGERLALALLAVAAVGVVISLIIRPPSGPVAAADRLAAGLALAIALSPASRWGYLVYPLVLLAVPRIAGARQDRYDDGREDRAGSSDHGLG